MKPQAQGLGLSCGSVNAVCFPVKFPSNLQKTQPGFRELECAGQFFGKGALRAVAFAAGASGFFWPAGGTVPGTCTGRRLAGGTGGGVCCWTYYSCCRLRCYIACGRAGDASVGRRGLGPGVRIGMRAARWCPAMLRTGGVRRSGPGSLGLWLRRLCRIGTQQTIFKGRPVKTANDRVHFLGIRRVDKREALGLLRFGIADNLYCVCDQVFGAQPTLDVVGGNPGGQVAQKYGKAHSLIIQLRWWGFASRRLSIESTIMLSQTQNL